MNSSQLRRIGVPDLCIKPATTAIRVAMERKLFKGSAVKKHIRQILETPDEFVSDEVFGEFAKAIVEFNNPARPKDLKYRTWGSEIDEQSHGQMKQACQVPPARAAALMPDAHVGYGLPIGGVLALENAVIPYAVGVDIACRMKLSVLDVPTSAVDDRFHQLCDSIERGTVFGVGMAHQRRKSHSVMDADWSVSKVVRENKDKAWKQLGSSGSGNHFVEFGILTLTEPDLGLASGEYLALLSHSGSRGTGASVCNVYSSIAQSRLPPRYKNFGRLAWLDLDSEAGQEYWQSMNLMGEYASANHAVIHDEVTSILGAKVVAGVENHHNFAWIEEHGGRELVVHRKGATPAGEGVLGVIPGSMASPAFVVRGKGQSESLASASHGAGRRMSRKKAKDTFNFKAVKQQLAKNRVHVISAGADEVPGVYKDIESVMSEQQDLVDVVARFDPRIVKMCGDGSRAED